MLATSAFTNHHGHFGIPWFHFITVFVLICFLNFYSYRIYSAYLEVRY